MSSKFSTQGIVVNSLAQLPLTYEVEKAFKYRKEVSDVSLSINLFECTSFQLKHLDDDDYRLHESNFIGIATIFINR